MIANEGQFYHSIKLTVRERGSNTSLLKTDSFSQLNRSRVYVNVANSHPSCVQTHMLCGCITVFIRCEHTLDTTIRGHQQQWEVSSDYRLDDRFGNLEEETASPQWNESTWFKYLVSVHLPSEVYQVWMWSGSSPRRPNPARVITFVDLPTPCSYHDPDASSGLENGRINVLTGGGAIKVQFQVQKKALFNSFIIFSWPTRKD